MEIRETRSAGDGVVPGALGAVAAGGTDSAESGPGGTSETVPDAGAASTWSNGRRSVTPAQNRVAQSLLMDGPASVVELAERLKMTPAGIRRHMDSLVSDGFVAGGDRPAYGPSPSPSLGRPPKIYSLTDEGRDVFDQAYDELAVSALRFLEDQTGHNGIEEFAEQRGREFEQRYLPLVTAAGSARSDRVEALATGLTEDGFAAAVVHEGSASGFQICQHNCPVAHVAEQFPILCEKETEAIQRLLGGTVTRLATIAHGDGVCTSLVMGQPATKSPASISSQMRADPDSAAKTDPDGQFGNDRRSDLTASGLGSGSR